VLVELELKTDAFFTIFSRIICSSNVLQLEIISVTYGKNKSGSGHYGSFHKFGLQVIQQLRGQEEGGMGSIKVSKFQNDFINSF
jgi:hypothetical protein